LRSLRESTEEVKASLIFTGQPILDCSIDMKISSDTGKAISVILFYSALLFGLLGFAARMKMNFHGRLEISTASFVTAAVLAAFGVVFLMLSFTRKV
jgi:hypothetical protein